MQDILLFTLNVSNSDMWIGYEDNALIFLHPKQDHPVYHERFNHAGKACWETFIHEKLYINAPINYAALNLKTWQIVR